MKIESFEDLNCWKACQELKVWLMPILRGLPKYELYDMRDNCRRAARSTTRNIAEGFGRHHDKENRQFVRISRGSLYEVKDDMITMKLEGYITEEKYKEGIIIYGNALRLTNGYLKYLTKRIADGMKF